MFAPTYPSVAPTDPELRSFLSSMPAAYRRSFSNEIIAIHAQTASARTAGTADTADTEH